MAMDFPIQTSVEHHYYVEKPSPISSLYIFKPAKHKKPKRIRAKQIRQASALKSYTGAAFFLDLQDDIIYVSKHIKLHPYQKMQTKITDEILSCLDSFHDYVKFELMMRQAKVKKKPNLSKQVFRQQYYIGQIEHVQHVIQRFTNSPEWDGRDPILVHTYGTLENYLNYLSRKIFRNYRQQRPNNGPKRASQEETRPRLYPLSLTDHSAQHHLIPHVYQSE